MKEADEQRTEENSINPFIERILEAGIPEWNENDLPGRYMKKQLEGVSDVDLRDWLEATKNFVAESFGMFTLWQVEKGEAGNRHSRSVTVGVIEGAQKEALHIHQQNAFLFLIQAENAFLHTKEITRLAIEVTMLLEVPRRFPHAFEVGDGGSLVFVTVQAVCFKFEDGAHDYEAIETDGK